MSKVRIVIDQGAGEVLCITNDDEKIKDAMYGQLVDTDIEFDREMYEHRNWGEYDLEIYEYEPTADDDVMQNGLTEEEWILLSEMVQYVDLNEMSQANTTDSDQCYQVIEKVHDIRFAIENMTEDQVNTLEYYTVQVEYVGWQAALSEYLAESDADPIVLQAFVDQWLNGSYFVE